MSLPKDTHIPELATKAHVPTKKPRHKQRHTPHVPRALSVDKPRRYARNKPPVTTALIRLVNGLRGKRTDRPLSDNSAPLLSPISLQGGLSHLYYLALSSFGCIPRIHWVGWGGVGGKRGGRGHMSPAHGDLTLCSLYIPGHTPRK